MIGHIIRKEILENLLSWRFVLSLLLVICLFAASGFLFVSTYRRQSHDYWFETNKNLAGLSEQSKQLYKLAFYKQTVWRKPRPLTFCAGGFERSLPDWFEFDLFVLSFPDVRSRSNFLLHRIVDMDWVFIVSLILSFVALLLAYDSVCGEKEDGTLRMILASSTPRYAVLLGKYVGAMITIGIPLLTGISVGLIIVVTSNAIVLTAQDWLRVSSIVIFSFLYVSVFVFLGIFVSTRVSHSATSMVVLLFVWVGLVILIPSLGRLTSTVFSGRPGQLTLAKKLLDVDDKIIADLKAGRFNREAEAHPQANSPIKKHLRNTLWFNTWSDAKNQTIQEHHSQMISQALAGRRFACISPVIPFQRASEIIAGTGIKRVANLRDKIKRYQADLKDYILSKDTEDPNSLHLLVANVWRIEKWNAISKKPVSFNTVPKFQEQDLALGQSLKLAIWDIGLSALFNLVFFAAAFVSFLRYDVR